MNPKIADPADSQSECIVCWSSGDMPAFLPCNHSICRDCLTAMRDRQQTHCPMCRYRLFHINDGIPLAMHKAVAAFVFLFVVGILATLQRVGELDLVQEKVVHRKPFPQF